MRFDNGSEYKSIIFGRIQQQLSAPCTQHQNGVAERINRSLITMIRCMLMHAGLPLRFWDAAVLTACYLRNRLPVRSNDKSPYELMNVLEPIISHFKVWGCVCYILIDDNDPKRYKILPTSLKGIFFGYCLITTQYQVYFPSKDGPNKIITSANVNFLEEQFWDWNNSSNEIFDIFDANPIDFSEQTVLRRSQRTPKPINPRSVWQPQPHALHVGEYLLIPQSYSEAISGVEKER